MVWKMIFLLFTVKSCQGVVQFTREPSNKTVNYGDIAEFHCHVQANGLNPLLELFIGSTLVPDDMSDFSHLDRREFFANENGTRGTVWILINNQTLHLFDYFKCRVIFTSPSGHPTHMDSKKAYINVKYPECTSQSCIQPTSTLLQDCHLTRSCTCDSTSIGPGLYLNPLDHEQQQVDNQRTVLYYQIAFGVCLSLVIIMLIILAIIVARMCIIRRKNIRDESSQNSANRICDALIRNPIYDGPVYESVQPRFETLTTAAHKPSTTSAASASDSFEQTNLLLDISNDSTRYVSKPSLSPVTQCGQPSPYIYPQDPINIEDSCRECPASTVTDEHSIATKMTISDSLDPNISKDLTCNGKEDAYTVMNPAGTLAASLSGGWDGEVTKIETMQ